MEQKHTEMVKVLQQVHPDMRLHASAMQVMVDFVDACLFRLAQVMRTMTPRRGTRSRDSDDDMNPKIFEESKELCPGRHRPGVF